MHWVIQKSIFKPVNYELLTNALKARGINYTSVSIPNGTFDLVPNVNPSEPVYVCGAIKLGKISNERSWKPGSFLNENYNFDLWLKELGAELLNHEFIKGEFLTIQVEYSNKFFIRPIEDNKAFDGMVLDRELLDTWRKEKKYLSKLEVIASPVKEIYKEYRLFVVQMKIITGSVYKIAGKPQVSEILDQDVINYANKIIEKWVPYESFVVDISLSAEGFKVIEFNNINSSGFYACDVTKYVEAIQSSYG